MAYMARGKRAYSQSDSPGGSIGDEVMMSTIALFYQTQNCDVFRQT